ncbi:HAD-IA family hydrolase [Shimia sp. CNT1-13L.2]|uniref:HAD family hydrolase n=1 Tax=Shimia sp. CNT1-13L.2 TaxID=2959663 RepID=UPI0020CCA9E3|nr:HAD-IA family hydrolase [Shimia sp. CNT1-13L.2]MCP9481790.1 HAD-IA family hydrolase [Shimia sp. CNT1-13L.2]
MIIFDFDGVLADSLQTCLSACTIAAQQQGREVAFDTGAFATLDPLTFEALAKRHHLDPDRFAADVATAVSSFETPSPVFDGIFDALSGLAKDHSLAVISASHSSVIRTVLAQQGIDALMKHIIGGDTPGQKPEKIAALVADLRDEKHVMVGDACSDIKAGRSAGIHTIAVAWGWQSPEFLAAFSPDAIVGSPAELANSCRSLLT